MKKVLVIGGGGHGRVVADILRMIEAERGELSFAGFIDDEAGRDVVGRDEDVPRIIESGAADAFILGIGSVRGGEGVRDRLFAELIAYGFEAAAACHPRAIIAESVEIGAGAAVMAGAVLNPGVRVGENAIINTGAVIDHDTQIGEAVHIAPGTSISGDVRIGPRSLIGVGASIRHGITIGRDATVGAGAVVVTDVADGAIVVGTPARPQP